MIITKEFTFDSAHQLPWHQGKCQRVHGHTYRLQVSVEGLLNENGVVVDFDEIKQAVKETVIDPYDHQFLNDFLDNPTAERLVEFFWGKMLPQIPGLKRVTLWETPSCSATMER